MRFSLVALLLAAGCSSPGSTESSATNTEPDPCGGCADGESCARLQTDDGTTTARCVEPMPCETRACPSTRCGVAVDGGDEGCIIDVPENNDPMNNADGPCIGRVCGETCNHNQPCAEGGVCPDVEYYCQEDGSCSTDAAPDCPADPCTDKACGESCTAPCPDGLGCPAVESYCQPDGSCTTDAAPECDADPCAGKACGAECSTCTATNSGGCGAVQEYCQPDGSCTTDAAPLCNYDPCDGKMCGDGCSLCDPADLDCVETGDEKTCDPDGVCVSGPPAC